MAATTQAYAYRNKILQHLSPDVIQRLHLTQVECPAGRAFEQQEQGISSVYFIESGVGSMTTTFEDGAQVEVALFGNESVIGVSAFMGVRRSLNRIYMQIAGRAFKAPCDLAYAEFRRCSRFQDLALRYVQMQLTQCAQTAGCNARHSADQRLCRWLLLCSDRAETEDLALSQEYLGMMLGLRRTTVSLTISSLKENGHLRSARGKLTIVDRTALERQSCECYRLLRDHLSGFPDFDQGFGL